jgi:hypothetical protein
VAHGALQERIHERREDGAASENNGRAEGQKKNDQGREPPLFLLFQEAKKFFEQLPHAVAKYEEGARGESIPISAAACAANKTGKIAAKDRRSQKENERRSGRKKSLL